MCKVCVVLYIDCTWLYISTILHYNMYPCLYFIIAVSVAVSVYTVTTEGIRNGQNYDLNCTCYLSFLFDNYFVSSCSYQQLCIFFYRVGLCLHFTYVCITICDNTDTIIPTLLIQTVKLL